MTKFDYFREKFEELSDEDKIALYNNWAREYDGDNQIYIFNEEFFNLMYENNPAGAVRAVFFGDVQSWNDDYIKFNGYANLESLSTYDVVNNWVNEHLEEIFEAGDFSDYIDINDWDWEEHTITRLSEIYLRDTDTIKQFVEEELFEAEDDDDVNELFEDWLKNLTKE